MIYELYKFEYIKERVNILNAVLVNTGYEIIPYDKNKKTSRSAIKVKTPEGYTSDYMQFNINKKGKITSFGALIECFSNVYLPILEEQERKYQQKKKLAGKKRVEYDAGFLRATDNFPGFSFVNKTIYVQPSIILECLNNIVDKILKGAI